MQISKPIVKTAFSPLIISWLLMSGLTACNKSTAPSTSASTAATATQTTEVTTTSTTASVSTPTPIAMSEPVVTSTTTVTSNVSATSAVTASTNHLHPAELVWVNMAKSGVVAILQKQFPKMSATAKACLSNDDNQNYAPLAKREMGRVLNAQELEEADTFYTSALGKKMTIIGNAYVKKQAGEAINPSDLPQFTPAEKMQLVGEMQKPYMKKIQADNQNVNELEMAQALIKIATQEVERCKVE